MSVKEVYSIRITKNDEEIKDYLEQFPVSKQNKALKSLLKYGIEKLQNNYHTDQAITNLEETIQSVYSEQEQKLKEIRDLLDELKIKGTKLKNMEETNQDEEIDDFDIDKARKSMEEALSMFVG